MAAMIKIPAHQRMIESESELGCVSSSQPTIHAAGTAVSMPNCRRREKYLPRIRSGTRSAIQVTHAGPPMALPQYMTSMSQRKTLIARRACPNPPLLRIHSGAMAITNQRKR